LELLEIISNLQFVSNYDFFVLPSVLAGIVGEPGLEIFVSAIKPELKLSIVPGYVPKYHGVVVALHYLAAMIPLTFIVLKLMLKYLLPVINQVFAFNLLRVAPWIIKVRNPNPIIIDPAMLNNRHVLSLRETPQKCLIRLLIHEVVRDPLKLVRVKVQNSNYIAAGFNNCRLELVHHDETVDGVGELVAEPLFSVLVYVHDTVALLAAH
jgi:hypothetical protein